MAKSHVSLRVNPTSKAALRRNFTHMFQKVKIAGQLNAYNGAMHLLSRTRAIVPYEKGDLYNAAYARKVEASDRRAVWEVGYDMEKAPHALIQHETPNYNHPTRGPSAEPKTDHFLSKPRDAMEKAYRTSVIDDVMGAIKRGRYQRTGPRR